MATKTKEYSLNINRYPYEAKVYGTPKETFEYYQKLSSPTFFSTIQEKKAFEYQEKFFGSLIYGLGLPYYDVELKTNGKSIYYTNSSKMKSNYWISPVELFARAWESYVLDKLRKAGRINNYLVSDTYQENTGIENGQSISVYPQGEEREEIFNLFEKLMETIKTAYQIKPFKAFSTVRQDEFIPLDKEKDTEEATTNKDLDLKIRIASAKYKYIQVRIKMALA